jgi:hypothetical protein
MGSSAGSIPASFAKLTFLRVVLLGQNRLTGACASRGLFMHACDIAEANPWQVHAAFLQLVPERSCCGHRHCSIWAKRLLHAAQPEQEFIGGAAPRHRPLVLCSAAQHQAVTRCMRCGAGTLPDVLRNSTLMQYVDLSRNYFRVCCFPLQRMR